MDSGTENRISLLNSARALARMGFHVFPVIPNSKEPAIREFPKRATKDIERIERWWSQKSYNIGVSTSEFNCTQGLVVVDIDNKDGKDGSGQLLKLELEGKVFPKTLSVKTPSNGMHLIFKSPGPVKQGTNVLAEGIDIRSRGGYVVSVGSVIDGKKYEFLDTAEIAECPAWIIDACKETPPEKIGTEYYGEVTPDIAFARGKFFLEQEAQLAVQGKGGDEQTFKIACHLKDMGISEAACFDLMAEFWNERCIPPWEPDELREKVRHAFAYGKNAPGAKSPEAQFEPITASPGPIIPSFLDEINKTHAIVYEDGGHSIIEEITGVDGSAAIRFYPEQTFKRKFSHLTVQQGRGRPKTQAEIWLDWGKKRQYQGICFSPKQTGAVNGYYNLWTGFAVKDTPYAKATSDAKKGFDMYMSHWRENISGGNEEHFHWTANYLAHLIQFPQIRPLTTVVLKGLKGVGKNAFLDRIQKLMPAAQSATTQHTRYLTSNFNAHLESLLVLVLDEAFWSGDKSADSVLKGITTERKIWIERKGKEPYRAENFMRIFILGNEDWLVPASADERRYAVFDVGASKLKDVTFFSEMSKLMDEMGGNEILLNYFKNYEVDHKLINVAPNTSALARQKVASLPPHIKFLQAILTEEVILPTQGGFISSKLFRASLSQFYKENNIRSWLPDHQKVVSDYKGICPSVSFSTRKIVDGVRCRGVVFPSDLTVARNEFNAHFGSDIS